MPRRLPEKTRNVPVKPRRYGSQSRFRSSRPFLPTMPVKENQELEVVIADIGSRGNGIARIQSYVTFVPKSKIGDRVRARTVSVREKFAITEKIV
jgi:predicted RNA-binding protein with TRAM domain